VVTLLFCSYSSAKNFDIGGYKAIPAPIQTQQRKAFNIEIKLSKGMLVRSAKKPEITNNSAKIFCFFPLLAVIYKKKGKVKKFDLESN